MAQPEAWPWVDDDSRTASILLMGDVNIQLREKPEEAFREVMTTMRSADFRFLNLEGAFAGASKDPNQPDIPHKSWQHSEPEQVAALTAAGIDAVGVANNVTYPWQALMRSLKVLDDAGIRYAGGGEDLEVAHQPLIVEKDGLRVGFMQYAATETRPGIAEIKVHTAYQPPRNLDKPGQPPIMMTWLDEESKARMVEDIRRLDEQADIVIVSYHWGVSGSTDVVSYQSDIGRAVIDAGADLVYGHGPHKPILHSLGQFIFDTRVNNRYSRFREGLLVRLAVRERKIQSVSLVPVWRGDDGFVRIMDPGSGKDRELYGYLQSVNEGGADLKLEGKEIRLLGLEKSSGI